MSLTYGFYNSKNHDRKYDARQFSQIFDGILTDGVYESYGNQLTVKHKSGRLVIVQTGRAWFNHTWTLNDTAYELTVDKADTLYPRYDTVILEVNTDDLVRKNSLKIINGSPASNPSKPVLQNSGNIHQYPLAHIHVKPNEENIIASDIQNVVGSSECPFVKTVMKPATLTDVYSKYEAAYNEMVSSKTTEFESWFRQIQSNLTGDQASKLWAYILMTPTIQNELNKFGLGVSNDTNLADALVNIVKKLNDFRIIKTNIPIRQEDCTITSEYPGYGYQIKIQIEGCTSDHIASVYMPMEMVTADIAPICKTDSNTVYIYARNNKFKPFKLPQIILEKEDF